MTRDIVVASIEARIALTEQFIERKLREYDELVVELELITSRRNNYNKE